MTQMYIPIQAVILSFHFIPQIRFDHVLPFPKTTPYLTWAEKHLQWYGKNGMQLCLTLNNAERSMSMVVLPQLQL